MDTPSITRSKPSVAFVDGQDYDVTRPDKDAIVSDMAALSVEEFENEWVGSWMVGPTKDLFLSGFAR